MEVNIKDITGNWDRGVVLDKHSKFSVVTGQNEWGHNIYDTTRTEVGEAVYQLKYKSDWTKVQPLAKCLYAKAYPLFQKSGSFSLWPLLTSGHGNLLQKLLRRWHN